MRKVAPMRDPRNIRVLVGCEESGIVRRAFAARGFDAWSCDLLPAADGSNKHYQEDVRRCLARGCWDMFYMAHPPCTRLCNSGVRWLHEPPGKLTGFYYTEAQKQAYTTMTRDQRLAFMWDELEKGADLFSDCLNADVPFIGVENPVMHRFAKERITNYIEPAQSVQPWHFGHGETKRTCLWLKRLPPLKTAFKTWEEYCAARSLPADAKPDPRVHYASGKDRQRERSKFFPGIADAMAEQWGDVLRAA